MKISSRLAAAIALPAQMGRRLVHELTSHQLLTAAVEVRRQAEREHQARWQWMEQSREAWILRRFHDPRPFTKMEASCDE